MTKQDERNLFLKYLADVYLQNPNLPINKNIIYGELKTFNVVNDTRMIISKKNLAPVWVALNNKYNSNDKAVSFTFGNGYFWAIENRNNKDDKSFYDELENSIKLYIAVEPENLYQISSALFDFMFKENITMQSKVAKEMRSDVLVCRVFKKEDVNKINKFLNEDLNYKSNIKPNPFILSDRNISLALDGHLSYNMVLATFIELYLESKREKNELDNVSDIELGLFIDETIKNINNNKELLERFKVNDNQKFLDLIRISNILKDNINNNLSINKLYKYQKVKDTDTVDIITQRFNEDDKEKILYVVNGLACYYSNLDEVHERIMRYIETGNINLFTRKNDIRKIVAENYTPSMMKCILKEMGWSALLDVSNETYQKYGYEQLVYAVDKLINENKIDSFTNKNDARSYLGFVIPSKILKMIIDDKIKNGSLTSEELSNVILDNINNQENKKHGR